MHFKTLVVATAAVALAVATAEEQQVATDSNILLNDASADTSKLIWPPYYPGSWPPRYPRFPPSPPIYYKRADDEAVEAQGVNTIDGDASDADELEASKWGGWYPWYRPYWRPWGYWRPWWWRRGPWY
ncbi:hypothetical protein DFQ26_001875 [Actinomortierella ambigua]|nr:hypothetical protein DFQ26_001875 [Actinomortierella ambigua]